MKIFIRHLASIFKRLSLNVSKQFSVIDQLVATSRFKPLKCITFDTIFAYQSSLDTFNCVNYASY